MRYWFRMSPLPVRSCGKDKPGTEIPQRARYSTVDLTVAAHREGVRFAIGAKRITTLWRVLGGIAEADRADVDRYARRPGHRGDLLPGLVAHQPRRQHQRPTPPT